MTNLSLKFTLFPYLAPSHIFDFVPDGMIPVLKL